MSMQKTLEDFQELALPDLKKEHESKLEKILERYRERIDYILKIRKKAKEHKNTKKRRFKQRLNTYSHMSGDPGDFRKLGFTKDKYGYDQFFSLTQEERNNHLDEIIEAWDNIFDKEELKENKKRTRNFKTGLPDCKSATKLKKAYQNKKREIEETFEVEKVNNGLEELGKSIEKLSKSFN